MLVGLHRAAELSTCPALACNTAEEAGASIRAEQGEVGLEHSLQRFSRFGANTEHRTVDGKVLPSS